MRCGFGSLLLSLFIAVQWENVAFAQKSPVETCSLEALPSDTSHSARGFVSGAAGERIRLFRKSPSLCWQENQEQCLGADYLSAGDVVEYAPGCSPTTYVRHHQSDGRVIAGWMPADRVSVFRFVLKNGVTGPVCGAYLSRLNKTHFDNVPYCGRPENNEVAGFPILPRRVLSAAEMLHFSTQVDHAINGVDRFHQRVVDLQTIELEIRTHRMTAWTYDEAIDIKNDHSPKKILIWQGYPVDEINWCGEPGSDRVKPFRAKYYAFILTDDGQNVDEAESQEVFGAQERGSTLAHRSDLGENDSGGEFHAVGTSNSVFAFQGRYYFDTFLDAPARKHARQTVTTSAPTNDLGVFLHEKKTELVCAFQMREAN